MRLLLLDASWPAVLLLHLLQRFLQHGRTMLRAHVQQPQAELSLLSGLKRGTSVTTHHTVSASCITQLYRAL